MTDTNRAVIAPETLDRLVEALRSAASGCSGRRSATARSSTTSSSPPPSCRSAGPTARTAAATGSSGATTRPASATRSGRTRGSGTSSRRACGSGARAANGDGAPAIEEEPLDETPLAFIGVRSCELHAIEIQDRVFLGGAHVDRDYAARRDGAFLVAVNCFEPGGTCFCTSMGTGPEGRGAATTSRSPSCSTASTASSSRPAASAGAEVLAELPARPRPTADLDAADGVGRVGRAADGPDDGGLGPPRPARRQPRASALGRRRRALPHLRQLHARLPDVLLLGGRGRDRPLRRRGRALARLGHVLLGRLLVHPRRQRSGRPAARATGSG